MHGAEYSCDSARIRSIGDAAGFGYAHTRQANRARQICEDDDITAWANQLHQTIIGICAMAGPKPFGLIISYWIQGSAAMSESFIGNRLVLLCPV